MYGSIECFQQQKANASESFIRCVFGSCLLIRMAFQGVVRAQKPEVDRQQQFHATLAKELKAILESQLESQLQTQCQHRLKECILYLFPNSPHQKWLQDQLKKWLQPIKDLPNILYDNSEDYCPSTEGSLCDSVRSLFSQEYQESEQGAMQNLFTEWVGWRFLAMLQGDPSSNLWQVISRDLSDDLRRDVQYLIPSNPYWNTLIKRLRVALSGANLSFPLFGSVWQDLALDFVPGLLQDKKEQLEQLISEESSEEQFQEIGKELCRNACQKILKKLYAEGERKQHLEALRHPFKDCLRPLGELFSANNFSSNQPESATEILYDTLTAHFKRKQTEIQSKFQLLFEVRLLGKIQAAFPHFTWEQEEGLQKQLREVFHILSLELCEAFLSWKRPAHYLARRQWRQCNYWHRPLFQALGKKSEQRVIQGVLFHMIRNRVFPLLQDQVQDLPQARLLDRSMRQLQVIERDKRTRTPLQVPREHDLDIFMEKVVLREGGPLIQCCIKDLCLDLLPKLFKDKRDNFLTSIEDNSEEDQLLELKEALSENLRQRALADHNQAHMPSTNPRKTRAQQAADIMFNDQPSKFLEKTLKQALFTVVRSDSCSKSLPPPQGEQQIPLPPTAPPLCEELATSLRNNPPIGPPPPTKRSQTPLS